MINIDTPSMFVMFMAGNENVMSSSYLSWVDDYII